MLAEGTRLNFFIISQISHIKLYAYTAKGWSKNEIKPFIFYGIIPDFFKSRINVRSATIPSTNSGRGSRKAGGEGYYGDF